MNNDDFIRELKQKREEYGVSQNKLAVACHISRTYLNQIENGKAVPSDELKQTILKQMERFNPQEPLFMLIDYFCVRFHTTDAMTVIQDILHINPQYMLHEDYGKYGVDIPKNTWETLYLGSTNSQLHFCIYQKNYEQYVKNGTDLEDTEIKNRFEIRLKDDRAYHAVVDLLTYRDVEQTAFSIINHYLRFVDREDGKPKSRWKLNADWAWFIGENREKLKLTTQPEPYTLERALQWLHRQVAPTLKMVAKLDKQNHTTILKDMIEHTKLKKKHKHLLQLEKSEIKDRIDTAVPMENDGIF